MFSRLFKKKQQVTQPSEDKDIQTVKNEVVIKPDIVTETNPITEATATKHKPKYTYERRKTVVIRNQIIDSINRFPKTTTELSKDIDVHYLTAKRHAEYLQSIGVLRKSTFKLKHGEADLWTTMK